MGRLSSLDFETGLRSPARAVFPNAPHAISKDEAAKDVRTQHSERTQEGGSVDYRDLTVERRTLERGGSVGRIVIDRPNQLNALRMTVTDRELICALDSFEAEDDMRAVILTGAGDRAFCTGWDLSLIEDSSIPALEGLIRANTELFLKIWHLRQPVIAAVNGHAVGTGAAIALAADLTVVSETARLAEPEIRHGALSPFLILPFLTHAKAAHSFYYTGDALDAQAMHRLGLANAVVPPEALADEAMRVAARLALVPPWALQMKKRSLRAAYEAMGFGTAIRHHALADTLVIGGDFPEQRALLDILEKQGMRAFLQARDGPFRDMAPPDSESGRS
ncbi:MAG: enoyl-CoA hydratase/isomerase family protein [Rhodospirillaceae bacterium]|nr:enoyl-CoA hydratase/isomerase family protein [Rhodospirillaceae bacterium]